MYVCNAVIHACKYARASPFYKACCVHVIMHACMCEHVAAHAHAHVLHNVLCAMRTLPMSTCVSTRMITCAMCIPTWAAADNNVEGGG